jgi:hypothetical protein
MLQFYLIVKQYGGLLKVCEHYGDTGVNIIFKIVIIYRDCNTEDEISWKKKAEQPSFPAAIVGHA